jgi:hypothetical protein
VTIHGVDFSGARDAGRSIWIASTRQRGDGLLIEGCRPASELPASGVQGGPALRALLDFIAQRRGEAFGIDFPFALPAPLMKGLSWEEFVLDFPGRFPSAEVFRDWCREEGGGSEPSRRTDRESKAPFSPCNLRLYRQTFHGIRDILYPLLNRDLARVLPMQKAHAERALLLEVCPACTLKREGLYQPYKGRGREAARKRMVAALEDGYGLVFVDPGLRRRVIAQKGGDALDSLVAALAARRGLSGPGLAREASREGHIYV